MIEIGNIGTGNEVYMNYRKRSEEIFSISEQTEQTTMKSELDYYKDLCKEFKNITFRLEDKQTAMSGGNQMGYVV